MRTFFKWFGIVIGVLVVIGLIGYTLAYFNANSRLNRVYAIDTPEIAVAPDAEILAHGEHLVTIFGCNGCHGENLAGAPMVEIPPLMSVYAPNLTSGAGGVLNTYTDAELERAIRHGVDKAGHPLIIMPSTDFQNLSDEDTAAIIAYLHVAAAVDNTEPESTIGPLGRVLMALGQLPVLSAEDIDHTMVRASAPAPGETAAYGKYLAATCQGCHMTDFAGGVLPGSDADAVPAANLTPGGELANWSTDEFINTVRTGLNPEGRQLDAEMPFEAFATMSDEELTAIFLFLQSLPPVEK